MRRRERQLLDHCLRLNLAGEVVVRCERRVAWRIQTLDGLLKLGKDISLDAKHLIQHAKLPKLGLLRRRGHHLLLHRHSLLRYGRTCSGGALGQQGGQKFLHFSLAGFLIIESHIVCIGEDQRLQIERSVHMSVCMAVINNDFVDWFVFNNYDDSQMTVYDETL